jgi:excinuclease ABC subunit C
MIPSDFSSSYRDHIPNLPGVYRYFDKEDGILYIGKAKDLKKRVSSYFSKTDMSYRIVSMVKKIQRIEYTIVETEQDAFLLENSLIKKYKPRYNILLRDDKTYPFIVIKNEPFPRVFLTRKVIKDGSIYLGPYTAVNNVYTILDLLKNIFPLRTCTLSLTEQNIANGKFKVCLEYHIKNCLGPCQAFQSSEEYDEMIDNIKEILKSNFGSVLFYLKKKMAEFAERLEFEKANEFKEKIKLLTEYESKSTVVNPKLTDIDAYGYTETDQFAFITFFKIINGTIIQSRSLEIKKILDEKKEDVLLQAIYDYSISSDKQPKEIYLPFDVDITFKNIALSTPQIGDKKRLIDLAMKNALYNKQEKLKQQMTAEEKNPTFRILATMKRDLKLIELPRHIECFDNSNIQGTNPVSAIVVFKDAKPSKKDYRFFNVKTVEGPDDFATMREAVFRRYKRMLEEGHTLPNLIIIDGGKGQLSSAVESLKELNIYGQVPIIGIAKRLEEIYYPEDSLPLFIPKNSESLKLIQKLRDEAHRFGITAHRNKRSKTQTNSALNQIKGVGDKTMEKLIKHFKSIKKLKEASLEDIAAVIGESKAKVVMEGLSKSKEPS